MKPAFSFIEVIVSVIILSYLGTAILNFNSFNKNAMRVNIQKQNTLLVANSMLHIGEDFEDNKEYKLDDLLTFKNLSDEDKSYLKSVVIKGQKDLKEKLFLYNDGKKDYYLEFANIRINYKNNIPLDFLSIQRPE